MRRRDPALAGPRGGLLDPPEALRERVEQAADAGLATMIHAIGDEAVRAALDVFRPSIRGGSPCPR